MFVFYNRKPPPPKVLPKPVRKKSVEQTAAPVGGGGGGGEEGEEEVFIPSRDPNMITIQSTSSTEPLNVRPVMAEEVELHGDIKIQKVAHTRWTPQKKPPEQVQRTVSVPLQTPPTESPPKQVSHSACLSLSLTLFSSSHNSRKGGTMELRPLAQ